MADARADLGVFQPGILDAIFVAYAALYGHDAASFLFLRAGRQRTTLGAILHLPGKGGIPFRVWSRARSVPRIEVQVMFALIALICLDLGSSENCHVRY